MTNITAVLSMLHEPFNGDDSAMRLFRERPVLWWTLERLKRSRHVGATAVLCWEDQLAGVEPIAEEQRAHVLAKGPRVAMPQIEQVTAARKWADGWRGGLLGTCEFDRGFHAEWTLEILEKLPSDAVVLVDPAAGLVDAGLIDALIDHAASAPDQEMVFSQAAPGLSGVLLRPGLLERLREAQLTPGRMLHYMPDLPGTDPIGKEGCAPIPQQLARTTRRFTLDSNRQIHRLSRATVSLNGQLMKTEAEGLLNCLNASDGVDPLPREVVLEINTGRATRPVWWPGSHLTTERAEMTVERAEVLFEQISNADDMRLTIAGVGDPLLSPQVMQIVQAAHEAGISAIHVETDLLGVGEEVVEQLAASPVDVVSVHLPAVTPGTYQAVMGTDGMGQVIGNIRRFLAARQSAGRGTPLLVPVFVKCGANLAEMEVWYDQWLRALGSAVVRGPSDYAGQIADCAVADMSPPKRRPCTRLASRMTVLCDGKIVACEQDVLGLRAIGEVGVQSIAEVWQSGLGALRSDHASSGWNKHPLCTACREWHRP